MLLAIEDFTFTHCGVCELRVWSCEMVVVWAEGRELCRGVSRGLGAMRWSVYEQRVESYAMVGVWAEGWELCDVRVWAEGWALCDGSVWAEGWELCDARGVSRGLWAMTGCEQSVESYAMVGVWAEGSELCNGRVWAEGWELCRGVSRGLRAICYGRGVSFMSGLSFNVLFIYWYNRVIFD